jgi:hypothetical protein
MIARGRMTKMMLGKITTAQTTINPTRAFSESYVELICQEQLKRQQLATDRFLGWLSHEATINHEAYHNETNEDTQDYEEDHRPTVNDLEEFL